MLPPSKRKSLENAFSKWCKPRWADEAVQITAKKPRYSETKVKESDIQKTIIRYLRAKKVFCWRNNTGVAFTDHGRYSYGAKGSPDILALHDGTFYGIEVKRPGGVVSLAQKEFIEKINQAGGVGAVVYSVDDVIKLGL